MPLQSAPRARGFSLIEIAVVLVIIGLILAAVLQGRQLIANAEYKSLKSQLSEHRNAFYTFRDRYNALPGDFLAADAQNRLGLADQSGNGDGIIGSNSLCDGDDDESCEAWQHLRAADMLDGNPNDEGTAASPSHTYGNVIDSIFTGTAGNDDFANKARVAGVPADVARRLDEDIDDDLCDEGRVAGATSGDCDTAAWPAGSEPIDIIYEF